MYFCLVHLQTNETFNKNNSGKMNTYHINRMNKYTYKISIYRHLQKHL